MVSGGTMAQVTGDRLKETFSLPHIFILVRTHGSLAPEHGEKGESSRKHRLNGI
jgi:hypothetical protein